MDDTGRGDILDAAFHGDVMLLESLVQTPEDANVADQTTGSTPLHEAPLVRPCAPTQLSLSSR